MNHIELVETAKEAIQKVFSDTSVPQSDTRASLEELRDYLDELLDTLPD
jgi:hypothetical protein